MKTIKIFDAELRFMNLIWDNEPITSKDLVILCENELGWKKSTTFTVLRRLCERGALKNENSIVESLISQEEVQKLESREHINKMYNGSLKAFFAGFLKNEKLTEEDINELRKIVEGDGER